jgi:membrane protease YdiL (CAAX protease family)
MGSVGPLGWLHLGFFGLLLPWAAAHSARKLAKMRLPPRPAFFVSVILQQVLFATLSLVVAWREEIPLFPPAFPRPLVLAATLVLFLSAWLGMQPFWRKAVQQHERRVHLTSPRTPLERRLWVGLSFAAGIGEELTYRGVLFVLLVRLTGSVALGALLAALVFGLGHVVQGGRAVFVTAGFGLVVQALTLWSGSLYAAMAIHVLYDIVAGFAYGRYAQELGYEEAPAPSEAPGPEPTSPPGEGTPPA